MHYVDENNDDLFRKAAKNYPLNTDSADWNKVAEILYDRPPVSQKPENHRKYLWLLLLLPLGPVCNMYIESKVDDNVPTKITQTESLTRNSLSQSETTAYRAASTSIDKKSTNNSGKNLLVPRNLSVKSIDFSRQPKKAFGIFPRHTQATQEQVSVDEIEKESKPSLINKEILPIAERPLPQEVTVERIVKLEERHVANINHKTLAVEQHSRKFFIGFEAGTGATTINFHKTKSLGLDVGLLIGFDVSKQFSVEAAFLSSRKFYYADGGAFNISKIYLPANTKITSVDGACRMIELPLALRYRFPSSQKKQWFVTAGVSNFFMQREDYDYQYLYLNSGQSIKRSKTYKNPAKEWMAAAQLSGGLLYNFKGTLGIKAEPYVQLPLKGVGTGKLPLTSAGLRFALVKKLF